MCFSNLNGISSNNYFVKRWNLSFANIFAKTNNQTTTFVIFDLPNKNTNDFAKDFQSSFEYDKFTGNETLCL
jgi:hypothetical protein